MWILCYKEHTFLVGFESVMLVALGLLSFLMVSNIRYPSFKKIDMKKGNVVRILVYLVIFFSFLYLYPIELGAIMVSAYLAYGIGRAIYTVFIAKYAKNSV